MRTRTLVAALVVAAMARTSAAGPPRMDMGLTWAPDTTGRDWLGYTGFAAAFSVPVGPVDVGVRAALASPHASDQAGFMEGSARLGWSGLLDSLLPGQRAYGFAGGGVRRVDTGKLVGPAATIGIVTAGLGMIFGRSDVRLFLEAGFEYDPRTLPLGVVEPSGYVAVGLTFTGNDPVPEPMTPPPPP